MCNPDAGSAANGGRGTHGPDRDAARADRRDESDPDRNTAKNHRAAPQRRTVLRAGALGVAASLAGCLGGVLPGSSEAPAAVSLADGLECDVCGMVIEQHPGPNGQLFYDGNSPEDHDNPARFDSLKQCLFPYKLEREQMGWDLAAAYVTDYSSVDYDVSSEGDTTTISSHTDPESFARAEDLQYVVNSEVEGAMGPDFVPFSTQGDAEEFADEYGGEVVSYGDIDEGLVGQ